MCVSALSSNHPFEKLVAGLLPSCLTSPHLNHFGYILHFVHLLTPQGLFVSFTIEWNRKEQKLLVRFFFFFLVLVCLFQ